MSDCGVCIGGFGDVYNEFSSTAHPKARKEHKCEECGRIIKIGETYQYFSARCEGEFFSQKTCDQCAEIRHVFSCDEGEMMGGVLWESMCDYVFPELTTANKCFVKLSAASKQIVLQKWNEWKF